MNITIQSACHRNILKDHFQLKACYHIWAWNSEQEKCKSEFSLAVSSAFWGNSNTIYATAG